MADVIQTEEMQDQYIPVLLFQLTVNVPGYIVVNLGKKMTNKSNLTRNSTLDSSTVLYNYTRASMDKHVHQGQTYFIQY